MSSLSLTPRYDQFRLAFDKTFLPPEVTEKWQKFLAKEPGVLKTPIDYLNESIKGITFPGISDINVQQSQHSSNPIVRRNSRDGNLGRINVDPKQDNTYVGSTNPLDRIDRTFKVTFRLNQGLYNYWMLYETIFYRICKHELYEDGENLFIDILNEDGLAVSRLELFQCNIDGIDGLDFSYDKVERQSDTFDLTFKFNNLNYEFLEIEEVP